MSNETTPLTEEALPHNIQGWFKDFREVVEEYEEAWNLKPEVKGNAIVTALDDVMNKLREQRNELADKIKLVVEQRSKILKEDQTISGRPISYKEVLNLVPGHELGQRHLLN